MIVIVNVFWYKWLLLYFLFKHQLFFFLTISFVFSHIFLNVNSKPMRLPPPPLRQFYIKHYQIDFPTALYIASGQVS